MERKATYLVALDLDGTSVRYEPRLEMDPDLMSLIGAVRERGVVWAMNSDRYTDTMADIAARLPEEVMPAALLSCQRFIHLLNGEGVYRPLHTWNDEQMRRHAVLWERLRPYFDSWRGTIEREFALRECVVNDLVFACMAPPEQTPRLRERMKGFIADFPDAQISGNHDWTFILHASFSKGKVLQKCAELLGIPRENIIAVGDGINDITMLDGSVTSRVGCPANASPDVVSAVQAAGGIVAQADEARGTMQILRHYLEDAGVIP